MGAVLVDPISGSAPLPIETALITCDIIPGLLQMGESYRGHQDIGEEVTLTPSINVCCAHIERALVTRGNRLILLLIQCGGQMQV